MSHHNYYVYILTNPGKTVLYVGLTNSLERRLEEHLYNFDKEAKGFAAKYHCYNLIYYEWYLYVNEAIAREKEIKGWSRAKKEILISTLNPEWRFLNSAVELEKGNLPQWNVGDEYWRPGKLH
jgi:putative endonuclease